MPKWYPNNITEYFFFDEFGFLNIDEAKIYECYGDFTETMDHVYENLKKIYFKFLHKIEMDNESGDLNFPKVI
jgi:hypothetical protein